MDNGLNIAMTVSPTGKGLYVRVSGADWSTSMEYVCVSEGVTKSNRSVASFEDTLRTHLGEEGEYVIDQIITAGVDLMMEMEEINGTD